MNNSTSSGSCLCGAVRLEAGLTGPSVGACHCGRYILPAGFFELDEGLEFDYQIFIDKKPTYYCFANETREMTGAEVFAGTQSQ
jgi:hypothetical protein